MNKYLEKIAEMTELAEMQKEAMRVSDLANIAKKVGLRREGDWRGLARQFADNTGALRPARERAGIRERITGIGNNAIQKVEAAQRKLRAGDEVSAFMDSRGKLTRVPGAIENKDGILPNRGMALLDPRQDSDGIVRQSSNAGNIDAVNALLMKSKGQVSNVHTHPFPSSKIFGRRVETTIGKQLEEMGHPQYQEMSYRRNLPVSSLGGADTAVVSRKGNLLTNKKDAHLSSREAPHYDINKLKDLHSEEFEQEIRRFGEENSRVRKKLSPVMQERLKEGVVGDVNVLPFINRRNTIIGGDKTLGVHTQPAINRYDDAPVTSPYWYQHAYFDINQGGHKAIRRMLKKGINPEDHGLNTSFMK